MTVAAQLGGLLVAIGRAIVGSQLVEPGGSIVLPSIVVGLLLLLLVLLLLLLLLVLLVLGLGLLATFRSGPDRASVCFAGVMVVGGVLAVVWTWSFALLATMAWNPP